MKSEEDLQPLTRQRSNTLPKSFGSQLEKKPAQEKVPKPPAETTLETILKKLQEKREEVNRPEDIKVSVRGSCCNITCVFDGFKSLLKPTFPAPLLAGYDPRADRGRESGPAERAPLLREHPRASGESPHKYFGSSCSIFSYFSVTQIASHG